MLNPVGVLFFGAMIRVSQGFTLGLNVTPLRGVFWTLTGSYIQAPGFNPGIYAVTSKPPTPHPERVQHLNPDFSGISAITRKPTDPDPKGVLRFSPEFYPGGSFLNHVLAITSRAYYQCFHFS